MNIEPEVINFIIKRGSDWSFTFDIDVDGEVVSLVGATVLAQVRQQMERTSTKMLDMGVSVDVLTNEITISLTDVQTAGVNRTVGYYDVLVIDAGGFDTYYLQGEIRFDGAATVKP